MSNDIVFATSNTHKVEEVSAVLMEFGIRVTREDAKGVEIQADELSAVAAHASREAAGKTGRPTVVEDAGLFIQHLSGFPGPYSAYAYKTIGLEGILRLLKDVLERRAVFRSVIAYCEPGGEPFLFAGSVDGEVSAGPAGSGGFGFDPIFRPQGHARTLAEMSIQEKCAVSHRGQAARKFGAWFKGRA